MPLQARDCFLTFFVLIGFGSSFDRFPRTPMSPTAFALVLSASPAPCQCPFQCYSWLLQSCFFFFVVSSLPLLCSAPPRWPVKFSGAKAINYVSEICGCTSCCWFFLLHFDIVQLSWRRNLRRTACVESLQRVRRSSKITHYRFKCLRVFFLPFPHFLVLFALPPFALSSPTQATKQT